MKTLVSSDIEFINEFYRIHTKFGTSQECCNRLEDLSREKAEPWKSILLGLCHILKGDGLQLLTYDNREEYEQAYVILDKVQKEIKDRKGLLFLFVERYRIDALALSFIHPIKEIEKLFDEVIEKFKADKTPEIQAEVAKAMLSKSFILWKYSKEAEKQGFAKQQEALSKRSMQEADKIIKTYEIDEYKNNANIQTTIAKTLMNRVKDLDSIGERIKEDSNKKLHEFVSNYGQSESQGVQTEVARAMFNIAFELYHKKIITDAEIKNAIFEQEKQISAQEVINAYERLKIKYQNSSIYKIQELVFLANVQQLTVYEYVNNTRESLRLCGEIIKYYDTHKDSLSIFGDYIEHIQERQNELQKQLKEENDKKSKWAERARINCEIDKLSEFYPDNKKHIEDLAELICDGNIVPFAGAGLSHFKVDDDNYAYPLWGEFIDGIYKKYMHFGYDETNPKRQRLVDVEPKFKNETCIGKATLLKDQLGQALFAREVIDIFSKDYTEILKEKIKLQPYALFPLLFRKFILTTNFDGLIEYAYRELKSHLVSCSAYDINKMDYIGNNSAILYKIHGTIEQPNTIILTHEDYKEHYKPDSANVKILNKFLRGNSILFMGCSLNEDENIMPFYSPMNNYALYPCVKEEIERTECKISQKNIIPILFPADEYHYIYDILKYCLFP